MFLGIQHAMETMRSSRSRKLWRERFAESHLVSPATRWGWSIFMKIEQELLCLDAKGDEG
jgi:hypothetical protein